MNTLDIGHHGHNGFAIQERQLTKGEQVPWHDGMDLRNWFPLTAGIDARGAVTLAWRNLQEMRFTDSFFENTLARQPRDARRVCHAPVEALQQLSDGLVPDAFIFHVSRCGSTLLTQLLAALPQCIVMSEPPIIDSVLRLHHNMAKDRAGAGAGAGDTVALLRQVMLALGQRRSGSETRFVIKFDCWHIHSMALLRQAFPGTPCLFLYRQPQAVLASHQRQRGPQMVPGLIHPALLPLPDQPDAPGDLDAYTGRVLASLFAAAQTQAGAGNLTLINYDQLPAILFDELLAMLAIDCTAQQLETMRQRSGFHSKYTGNTFSGDPQQQIPRLQQIAALVEPAYQQLERLRRQASDQISRCPDKQT